MTRDGDLMPESKRRIALGWAVFSEVIIIIIITTAFKTPGSRSQSDSLCCRQTHTKIRYELLGSEMNKRKSLIKVSLTRQKHSKTMWNDAS